jgi:predicted porin
MVLVKKTAVQAIACSTDAHRKKATTLTRRKQAWCKQGAGIVFAIMLSFLLAGTPLAVRAQAPDDKQALEKQIQQLAKDLQEVQARLDAMQEDTAARDAAALKKAAEQAAPAAPASHPQATPQSAQAPQPPAPGVAPGTRPGSTTPSVGGVAPDAVYNLTLGAKQPTAKEEAKHKFFERKPGRDLTFYTKGGEITVYGNLDVSFDDATKGLNGVALGSAGASPVGNGGWMEDISTNLAFIGVRGIQGTNFKDVNFIYQLETGINISTSPGLHESNSQEQDTVDGTLFTRNSYIGLGKKGWGALLIGKTDAPYKQSTARMNPFSGMEGDYQVIMSNTGGDNRYEFGARLDHSIWYTSPNLHGINFNAFLSPGQNRANNSDNVPAGAPACNGGDNPGNGGLSPIACIDGSYSDVVSGNLSYTKEPLYITVAYERHMKVNRQGDITGIYSGGVPSNYSGPITTNDPSYNLAAGDTFINMPSTYLFWAPTAFFNADVANEDAGKIGIQYGFFKNKTVVNAIFEDLHRYVPGYLEWQNERQRLGSWLAVTQAVGKSDSLSIGWARAYRTPGDPGQHNSSLAEAPYDQSGNDMTGGRGVNNQANMFTAAYKHRIGDGLVLYFDWAGTYNDQYAHFNLGAGGRGVTTDCHDASDTAGSEYSNPHCWTGVHLKAASIGLQKRF